MLAWLSIGKISTSSCSAIDSSTVWQTLTITVSIWVWISIYIMISVSLFLSRFGGSIVMFVSGWVFITLSLPSGFIKIAPLSLLPGSWNTACSRVGWDWGRGGCWNGDGSWVGDGYWGCYYYGDCCCYVLAITKSNCYCYCYCCFSCYWTLIMLMMHCYY